MLGIGSAARDRLGQPNNPKQLRPFAEIQGATHAAVATPGDLLFHIRSRCPNMWSEIGRISLNALGDALTVVEVQGFCHFDAPDLLGFVDETENPTGHALPLSSLIQPSDDPDFSPVLLGHAPDQGRVPIDQGGARLVKADQLHDRPMPAHFGYDAIQCTDRTDIP